MQVGRCTTYLSLKAFSGERRVLVLQNYKVDGRQKKKYFDQF
jgi:hypothetical protein